MKTEARKSSGGCRGPRRPSTGERAGGEVDLLPCPFCKSAVVTIGRSHVRGASVGAWFYYGVCGDCGARGPTSDDKGFFYLSPEAAAAAWNRRAEA